MSAHTYIDACSSNLNQSMAKLQMHFCQLFLLCVNTTEVFY